MPQPAPHPHRRDDISFELAILRGALGPDAPATTFGSAARPGAMVKSAIAGAAMIPTVLGAIAAGAAERPDAQELQPPAARQTSRDAHVIAPIRRIHLTPPAPGQTRSAAPVDFSFHPRFKAILASERGLRLNTGRAAQRTLYRVAPGDSLYMIAERVLGNGARWREIYAANRGKVKTPSLIRVGMTLSMPAAPATSTYHVAKGDSLYRIAAKQLKNPERWREIAALNKTRLKGGTMVYPHQVLRLPTV